MAEINFASKELNLSRLTIVNLKILELDFSYNWEMMPFDFERINCIVMFERREAESEGIEFTDVGNGDVERFWMHIVQ